MLTRREFLLPCLHRSLTGECIGRHYTLYDRGELAARLVYVLNATFVAIDSCPGVVPIFLCLCSYCQLRYFLRGLITLHRRQRCLHLIRQSETASAS